MSNALQLGDVIVTSASGIVGTVQEIIVCKNGSLRVRIAYDGVEKWTTIKS